MKNFGLHHHLTEYRNENDELVIVSWLQLDFGRWYRPFSVRKKLVRDL